MEKTNQLIKKFTPEEVKDRVLSGLRIEGDFENLVRDLGDELLPKYFYGTDKEKRCERRNS